MNKRQSYRSDAAAPPPAETLAEARRLIRSARFEAAAGLLSNLLESVEEAELVSQARYTLAVARRYAKQYTAALQVLEDLLEAYPDHARAWQEQGHTYLALNKPVAARAAFARATRLNPGLLASWKALAGLHQRDGDPEAARFAAVQQEYLQHLPASLRNALDLLHEGKLFKAEGLCREFLKGHPRHIEGMRILAQIAMQLRIYDDAEFLLESCVEFAPGHVGARTDYLRILHKRARFDVALEQSRKLSKMQPANPAFPLATANALAGLGQLEDAVDLYRQCLPHSPNQAGVQVMLGHALKALGRLDAAVSAYCQAAQVRVDYGDAYWSLANTKTYRFGIDEIETMRDIEARPGIDADDRVHLSFALGKALEDTGDYSSSFKYYARGNNLKASASGYAPERTEAMVNKPIQNCTAALFEQLGSVGCDAPDPIFIVGLPRAGSTLLEQILASHSMVDGTMELHDILALAQRLRGRNTGTHSRYPANLGEIDPDYFSRFGQQYLDNTRVYRQDAPFFIDKMPNNFMHIGLIKLILPNAKVIDARRHPLACGFSCFKQLFGEGQDFSYGLDAIGRYYAAYVRLMEHWDRVLPGFVLRVEHEDVVENLDNVVHRMLDFCGLPFEESCLRYYENERTVRTPSSEQVRQPIYRSGLDYWRNYDDWLTPLRAALGPEIREHYHLVE